MRSAHSTVRAQSCLAASKKHGRLTTKQHMHSAFIFLSLFPALAVAESPLKLQVVQRPPYLLVEPNGAFSGLSVEPTRAAFKKASIAVTWEQVPALRQLQRLKDNKERVCSVGWYKTAERAQFAKFTSAVSQDSRWAALANHVFQLPKDGTVHAILANRDVTVLFKTGYVYGAYLDRAFASMQARRMETNGDMPLVFQMIARGRAQITFAPLEEIKYYLKQDLIKGAQAQIIEFREMPEGYKRFLMCSRLVEDDIIRRFNAALP